MYKLKIVSENITNYTCNDILTKSATTGLSYITIIIPFKMKQYSPHSVLIIIISRHFTMCVTLKKIALPINRGLSVACAVPIIFFNF